MGPGLAFASHVALGIFLSALALVVWRRSPDRGTRGPLALFLLLVAANYLLEGLAAYAPLALGVGRAVTDPLHHVVSLTGILDPPALVAVALALGGAARSRAWLVAIAAPPVAIALLYLAQPPTSPYLRAWRYHDVAMVELVAYYAAAFAILCRAYLREPKTLQRDRLGALVVAFSVVVLPRIALMRLEGGPKPAGTVGWIFEMVGILVALTALTVLAATLAAPAAQRAHVRRTMRAVVELQAIVGAAWLLMLVPVFFDTAYFVAYSTRWFIFAAVFSLAVRNFDLLDLPAAAERRLRVVFALACGILVVGVSGALISSIPGVGEPAALGMSALLLGLVVLVVSGVRHASPARASEAEWRAQAAYRAHVELGTPDAELDGLRQRLGVSERDARRLREAVAVERLAPPPAIVDLAEGATLLGRYDVRRFLGAGSFGRAFVAWDRVGGEHVVLKEISPAWRSDAEALERFRREAQVALRVRHPSLVSFRSLERAGEGHVLVLGFVEGESLRARLARGPLAPHEAARVGRDLAAGLHALHEAGIMHRDVKPDNVILTPEARAVLLDFGSATLPATGTRPAGGAHPGTRDYMSPEQARGDEITPASDVFALGVTLWEALGGAPPPAGEVPGVWRAVLERAMDRDPARRFATAAEMAEALPVELVL